MKLKAKMIRTSVLVTVGVTLIMLFVCRYVVIQSFSRLQEGHLREHLQQAKDDADAASKSLDCLAQEFATRTAFLTSPAGYASLTADTLKRLDLDEVVVFDQDGQVVFSRSSGSVGKPFSSDLALLAGLMNSSENPDHAIAGIIALAQGPALVVSRQVRYSSSSARGTLVMTRSMSGDTLTQLYATTKLALRVRDIRSNLPPPLLAVVQELRSSHDFASRPLEGNKVAAYCLLKDVMGEPRFLLEVNHDRNISNEGLWISKVLAASMLGFGIVFCLLEIVGATRDVLLPVEKIDQLIQQFTTDKPFTMRLVPRGNDEIAALAKSVNRLLDETQIARERLLAARERLQHEATHDALTGCWNRAAAMELLDREIARSSRDLNSVAVVMFDADHFKKVNDCYGHSAGDIVLQHITAVISRNLRSFDVLARYGGEEFLVIAPNCTSAEARMLTDRILHRLEETAIRVNEEDIFVTLSAGVSSGTSPYTAEELIDAADTALYRAKSRGRNCVDSEVMGASTPRKKMFVMPRRIM